MNKPLHLHRDVPTAPGSVQTFEQLSTLLESTSSDAESSQLSTSMGELAQRIEAVIASRALPEGDAGVGPVLVELMAALRRHRSLVVGLGPAWRSLYEYAAYLAALNNFRVLLGQWLMERNVAGENANALDDFELIGWRTLGEGMMLMDVYQQMSTSPTSVSELPAVGDSRIARAKNWWSKVRG